MTTDTPVFPIVDGKYHMEKEPVVRIGVILEEDAKKEVRITLPGSNYRVMRSGSDQILFEGPTKKPISIHLTDDGLDLFDPNGNLLCEGCEGFEVIPPVRTTGARRGDGALVHELVSGRGFHWQKKTDQTLTGRLELVPKRNAIVMVNALPLEEYLLGVITGEMGGDCPIEFLKAQTVAARSWLLAQPRPPHPDEPFIWCNDDCCQRYQGTGGWSDAATRAVQETRGEVLITPTNKYCDARYSKNTGGVSEDGETVWGEPFECLESVVDAPDGDPCQKFFPVTDKNVKEFLTGSWLKDTYAFASANVIPQEKLTSYLGRVDEPDTYFRWHLMLTHDQMAEALRIRGGAPDCSEVLDLVPKARGRSGRLHKLEVVYRNTEGKKKTHLLDSEYNIRAGLSMKFLYSGLFIMEKHHLDNHDRLETVELTGGGWGHGAGLCQMGGLGRALRGQDYATILAAYFTGSRLEAIYE